MLFDYSDTFIASLFDVSVFRRGVTVWPVEFSHFTIAGVIGFFDFWKSTRSEETEIDEKLTAEMCLNYVEFGTIN